MNGSHTPILVFDIQRYSLHDGPGLRTNVYLKGCPLGCQWCANPEGQRPESEVAFFDHVCFDCGDCVPVCPTGAIGLSDGGLEWDTQQCNACGRCVEACTAGAFRVFGEEKTPEEIVAEALRDVAFYDGGGGLTLTGGEPIFHPAFSQAVLRLAKKEGLHTAIETCGHGPWRDFEALLPFIDLVLYDVKHMDPDKHRRSTGVDNRLILENARRMARAGVPMVVRVPLIPRFNADQGSLGAIAAFVRSLDSVREVHLLPYHTLGKAKYTSLGRNYPLDDLAPIKPEDAEPLADIVRQYGLHVTVGG